MYNLGVFEWYGIGGPRDMKLAMKLWKSAAALGEERAIKAVKIGRPAN
jgi:TPR repeat protein